VENTGTIDFGADTGTGNNDDAVASEAAAGARSLPPKRASVRHRVTSTGSATAPAPATSTMNSGLDHRYVEMLIEMIDSIEIAVWDAAMPASTNTF
jgi:hypothetical protein